MRIPCSRRALEGLVPFLVAGLVASAIAPSRAQVSAAGSVRLQRDQAPVRSASPQADAQPVLRQYCFTCHNQRAKVAGLTLDTLDLEHVGPDAATWEKVIRKIRTGMMPPSGARRPERAMLDGFASELEARIDRAAASTPNPGTPALHRLNRSEYANAIRDLLDLDVEVKTLLPPDDSSEGFDNIADALGVSPSLIQGYVSAAMKISRRAVGDRNQIVSQTTYSVPAGLSQDRHIEGLPLGTRGGLLARHTFPLDAEYDFSVTGGIGGPGGTGGGASIDVTLDGEKVALTTPRNFRLPVKAGPHVLGLALVDRVRGAGVDEAYSDFRVNAAFTVPGGVQTVVITGPINPTGPGDTPSRRRIFVCRPDAASGSSSKAADRDSACARKIISTLARRAYRRPVLDDEVETLMGFYHQGRRDADFETGIQQALARVLVAPAFLYRAEEEPANIRPGAVYQANGFALASRLSFFLWSSIPDDELLDLAGKGRLSDPKVREQQVKRMLADPKADALIANFAGQWLYLRDLVTLQTEAKGFDENLRQAFRRETEMLFESIMREDRSVLNLIDADYTFVDERLARHYGMPNIRGSYMRRVPLDANSPRRGLLGQGSMLTVTSVATRTSPVSRGKWILENLLGTSPPVPPASVDTNLDKDAEAVKVTSLRQRLEMHRTNPVCASCHKIMDPLGFALENFDLIGAWRDRDGPSAIDASGVLVDGTPISSTGDLRRALLSRSDAFVTNATEKLMTYALGRGVQYYDMPIIRAIVRRAAQNDYRFSSLVLGIVESDAFKMRTVANLEKRRSEK